MTEAERLIRQLELSPHPEGGWFRETWRAPASEGQRAASTAILFLLQMGEKSHWHRVDADEIWLWQGGDSLRLSIAPSESDDAIMHLLGPGPGSERLLDQFPQRVVPSGHWQAAEPCPGGAHGYVLVGCVVAPGFDFSGFELAPPGWKPGNADSRPA